MHHKLYNATQVGSYVANELLVKQIYEKHINIKNHNE